jgi:hypothetical protein
MACFWSGMRRLNNNFVPMKICNFSAVDGGGLMFSACVMVLYKVSLV